MPDKYKSELLRLSTNIEEDVLDFLDYIHSQPSIRSLETALSDEVPQYACSIRERYQHKVATLFAHTADMLQDPEINRARNTTAWAFSTVCANSGQTAQSISFLKTVLFREPNHKNRFIAYIEIAKLLNIQHFSDPQKAEILDQNLQPAWLALLEWIAESLNDDIDIRITLKEAVHFHILDNLIPTEIIIQSFLELDIEGHRLKAHYYAILCYIYLHGNRLDEAQEYLRSAYMTLPTGDKKLHSFLRYLDQEAYKKNIN